MKSIEENDGKRTARKSGSVENSGESDTEDGRGEKPSKGGNSSVDSVDELSNNKDDYLDSAVDAVGSRTRSDSLLDESVPDISDLPMQPIPSPSVTNTEEFTFNKQEDGTEAKDITQTESARMESSKPESEHMEVEENGLDSKVDSQNVSELESRNVTDISQKDSKLDVNDIVGEGSKTNSMDVQTSELLENIELKIVEEGDEQMDKPEDSSSSENSETAKTSGAIAKYGSDNDLYSEAAMEELEKLGAGESNDLPEKDQEGSEIPQNTNHSNGSAVTETVDRDVNGDSKKVKGDVTITCESVSPSVGKVSSRLNPKAGDSKSSVMRRKGSGPRQRPMSMVCSPRAELAMRAMQEELARRSSLHLSEDELSNSGVWR